MGPRRIRKVRILFTVIVDLEEPIKRLSKRNQHFSLTFQLWLIIPAQALDELVDGEGRAEKEKGKC